MAVSCNRGCGDAGEHQWLGPVGGTAKLSRRAALHILLWHVLVEFRPRRCGSSATVTAIDTLSGANCPGVYGSSGGRCALTTGHTCGGTATATRRGSTDADDC